MMMMSFHSQMIIKIFDYNKMAAARRADNMNFGNANISFNGMNAQSYNMPVMSNLDPFAAKKKGK